MKLTRNTVALCLAGSLLGFGLCGFQNARAAMTATPSGSQTNRPSTQFRLPSQQIQEIIGAQGETNNSVLEILIARADIGPVAGPMGARFTSDFQIHGELHFQPLANKLAFLNGDLALLEPEVNPFIAALLENGLVFQGFHQHTPMSPQVWFVHFRGVGDPLVLARAARNAISVTATPLPQQLPSNPTTSLDTQQLAQILRASDISVGYEGVVTATMYRRDNIFINGLKLNPASGISTKVQFRPTGAASAEVVVNFSMAAREVNPVVRMMLKQFGWYQGCLYNQELNETPQLYFDHMVKTGDPNQLAAEIRQALDLTKSR